MATRSFLIQAVKGTTKLYWTAAEGNKIILLPRGKPYQRWVLNKEGEKYGIANVDESGLKFNGVKYDRNRGSEKITTEYYDPITTETTSTSQLFNIVSGDNHTPVAIKSALDTRQNLIAKDGPVPNSQIVSTDSDTPRYEWSIIELDH
ncbi:hypothetical protein RclHR1_08110005 [Rhizophagus clarus]|uniref:Uncharacterized protein n=1 Tax=Rhizophagus clarus TaxID=94130 RepID=A0A2Z6SB36_9GLOM|nr:hypothetical protein RclHR1_08110005 [Rhizophagus clarus]